MEAPQYCMPQLKCSPLLFCFVITRRNERERREKKLLKKDFMTDLQTKLTHFGLGCLVFCFVLLSV